MKIPTVAIIDDGINTSWFPKKQFIEHFTSNQETVLPCEPANDFTHGSVCYQIFREYTHVPHRIISIKPLDSETGSGQKDNLLSALHWCTNQDIDLIHMSIGTRQFLDFVPIAKAVKALSQTVIVAACSNQNTLTFPACIPGVLGVQHCGEANLHEQISLNALIELYYNYTLPDIIFLHMNTIEARSFPRRIKADIVLEPSWFKLGTPRLFEKIKGLLS